MDCSGCRPRTNDTTCCTTPLPKNQGNWSFALSYDDSVRLRSTKTKIKRKYSETEMLHFVSIAALMFSPNTIYIFCKKFRWSVLNNCQVSAEDESRFTVSLIVIGFVVCVVLLTLVVSVFAMTAALNVGHGDLNPDRCPTCDQQDIGQPTRDTGAVLPDTAPQCTIEPGGTLFTYFQTSSKTFLLLVLLEHRARSRLLQLTRYINYLLRRTYLLT